MVLLFLLPFYDRNPERNPLKRPIASTAGILTIASMAFLTFLGAEAGSPTEIDLNVAPENEAGKLVAAQSGCLACHQFGHNGNNGPGPKLTAIGARLNPAAISRSLIVGPGIMPSYSGLQQSDPGKFRDLVLFLGSLNGEEVSSGGGTGIAGGAAVEGGGTSSTSGATAAPGGSTSGGSSSGSSGGSGTGSSSGGGSTGSGSSGSGSAGSGSSGSSSGASGSSSGSGSSGG